jgi:hypothetical protein
VLVTVLELFEVLLIEPGLEFGLLVPFRFGWFCCQKMYANTASSAKTTSKPRFCSIRDMPLFYGLVCKGQIQGFGLGSHCAIFAVLLIFCRGFFVLKFHIDPTFQMYNESHE